jgi:hypothetical protein
MTTLIILTLMFIMSITFTVTTLMTHSHTTKFMTHTPTPITPHRHITQMHVSTQREGTVQRDNELSLSLSLSRSLSLSLSRSLCLSLSLSRSLSFFLSLGLGPAVLLTVSTNAVFLRRASPKSHSFTSPLSFTSRQFCGFKSLHTREQDTPLKSARHTSHVSKTQISCDREQITRHTLPSETHPTK